MTLARRPDGPAEAEPPDVPGFRTWRGVYLFVFGWFVLVVVLLTVFTGGFWLIAYIVLVFASPVFIYHALYAWKWVGWPVAYGYAAILGALLGGLFVLVKYSAAVAKAIRG